MQKFTIDIPLVAKINANLKIQAMYPHEPILERQVFFGKSLHDCAAAYLALWMWRGYKPPTDDRLNGVIRLAEAVIENIGQYRCIPEVVSLFECQNKLVTQAHYRPDGSLTFINMELSDKAKRQQRELREKEGGNYHGLKVIRKKERCKPFDQRRPTHWRKTS